MNFKTNLNKLTLLSNTKIKIYFEDKTIDFIPPNIINYFSDLDFLEFKFLLKQNPKNFSSEELGDYHIENEYEFFLITLKTGYKKEQLLNYFLQLFPNLEYKNNGFYSNNISLKYEEYLLLLDILEISCGEKDLDKFLNQNIKQEEVKKINKDPHLAELEAKMKAGQEKLEELKKSKKQKEKNGLTIDQIVIAILYEFPSFKLEDILRMNVFAVLYLWENVGKVIDTEIQKIAAGNGLLKDFTYFIN